jgi:hypothetical protein
MAYNLIRQTNYKIPTCFDIVSTILNGMLDEFKNQLDKETLIKNIQEQLKISQLNSTVNCNVNCNVNSNQKEKIIYEQEKVHPLINQIGLDENLITNIRDIVTDVISQSNYFPNIQVMTDADLDKYVVINKKQALSGRLDEVFAEPKQVITDFTSNLFFTSEEKYYNFISKFIKFMEDLIRQYCIDVDPILNKKFPGHEPINDKIIFVFKGGNLLKGYFLKYLSEQPGVVSEFIRQIYGKNFKNSDLDFQIIIQPNLHRNKNIAENIYEHLYNDLLKLSYLALNRWRNYMMSDISEIINFYQLNSHTKKNILEKCKDKINSASIFDINLKDLNGNIIGNINAKKQYQREKYGEDADIFVGSQIENLQFYNINTHQNIYDEYVLNKNNPTFLKQRDPNHNEYDNIIDRLNNTYEEHIDAFQRADFYITTKNYNGFIYTLSQKLYKSQLNADNNIQQQLYPNGDIKSEFYITVNDHVEFNSLIGKSSFGLVRMKFNTIGYIRFQDNTRGMINIPGEFIDISISKYDDSKQMKKFSANKTIKAYHNRYNFHNQNSNINMNDFNFWSYNIHGFVSDIYDILYEEYRYPWSDIKYKKRLERLFIFSIFEILFTNQNINIFTLQQNQQIRQIFNLNYDDPQINILNGQILAQFNTPYLQNLIIYKIIEKHSIICNRITSETDPIKQADNIAKFNEYKQLCQQNLLSIDFILRKINDYITNPTLGHINEDRMNEFNQLGGYYHKYLKYKQKYLENKRK